MPADRDSPVDLPGSEIIGGHPLRWTAVAILVATALLALTNAIAIDGWAAELPPTAELAPLVDATATWHDRTDRLGLGAPRAAMHAQWKAWQAARLPGQPAPDQR